MKVKICSFCFNINCKFNVEFELQYCLRLTFRSVSIKNYDNFILMRINIYTFFIAVIEK